jgi:ABC-type phosphate transport system ATPase subunit
MTPSVTRGSADETTGARFMGLGQLVEFEQTERILLRPTEKRAEDSITGGFG